MLFTQFEFIFFFLPAVLFLISRYEQNVKWETGLLVLSSFVFYAYWDYRFLPFLLISILANWQFGRWLSLHKRKDLLTLAILTNLLPLLYFKYWNFLVGTLSFDPYYQPSSIILPLGISFFTFTQIAYLVDIYRRETTSEGFLNYSFFVSFFPHLIAGPIVRAREITPQIHDSKRQLERHHLFLIGLIYFAIGYLKKFAIADNLAPIADETFNSTGPLTWLSSLSGTLAFTFQIYFDFSGYSDMAMGLAALFGYRFPINFDSPYKAHNIVDFWKRWHITLSRLLRDYLYIPLGGNRRGELLKYRNILITMLIGGLWHGAGWNFLIWGGLHGFMICLFHLKQKALPSLRLGFAGIFITFCFVSFTWIFFRAHSFDRALEVIRGFSHFDSGVGFSTTQITWLVLAALLCALPNSHYLVPVIGNRIKEFTVMLFELRRRIFIYALISHCIAIAIIAGFYSEAYDKPVLSTPIIAPHRGPMETRQGSLRANLWSSELFRNESQKIAVVGASYVNSLGAFEFNSGQKKFNSIALSQNGSSIYTGLRFASLALDHVPQLNTLVLAISPVSLNTATTTAGLAPVAFPKECVEYLNQLGFRFNEFSLSGCQPRTLKFKEHLKLFFDYRHPDFSQVHSFLFNAWQGVIKFPKNPAMNSIALSAPTGFKNDFEKTLKKEIMRELPSSSGQEELRASAILNSLQVESSLLKSLKALHGKAMAQNVRLIVYDTPTVNFDNAPFLYPKDFHTFYRREMKKQMKVLQIEYYDLIDLLPWSKPFFSDYLHLTPRGGELLHQYLVNQIAQDGKTL